MKAFAGHYDTDTAMGLLDQVLAEEQTELVERRIRAAMAELD